MADLGDLKDIIVEKVNWQAFEPYFREKRVVIDAIEEAIGLRVGSMHPAEREIWLLKQVSALNAMVNLAQDFHPETARAIARIFEATVTQEQLSQSSATNTAGEVILSN